MQEPRVHLGKIYISSRAERGKVQEGGWGTEINAARTNRGQKGPWEAETIPRQDLSVLSGFHRTAREKNEAGVQRTFAKRSARILEWSTSLHAHEFLN